MLTQFLTQVFEHGRVTVAGVDDPVVVDDSVRQLLTEADSARRLHLPSGLPELEINSAVWGAQKLYHSAVLLVHRAASADQTAELLQSWSSSPAEGCSNLNAAVHYSVDLCLRFMGDVIRMNQLAASDDPVSEQLLMLLREWPLSAVGSGVCEVIESSPVWQHPSLKLMFLDRAVKADDRSVLTADLVVTELQHLAGGFPELFGDALP